MGHQTSKGPHSNPTAVLDPRVACWAKVQEKKVKNLIAGRSSVCRCVLWFVFGDGCTCGTSEPLHCSVILLYRHCPCLFLLEGIKGCVHQKFKDMSRVCISLPATLQIIPKEQAQQEKVQLRCTKIEGNEQKNTTHSKKTRTRQHILEDTSYAQKRF